MTSEWAWRVVRGDRLTLDNIAEMVRLMAECVLQNEVPFCKMDSYAGDGDFGMSVAKGFREVKREWNGLLEHHRTSIGDFLGAVSLIIMSTAAARPGRSGAARSARRASRRAARWNWTSPALPG